MAALPQNARDLAREVIRFCDGAATNPAEYGTDAAELADLRAAALTVIADEDDKDVKQDALDASVTKADGSSQTLQNKYRPVRRDAYATASDEELREIGLEPHKERSLSTPLAPLDLIVRPDVDGTNRLFWKRGDEVDSTLFDVEVEYDDDGKWALAYSTGARKFDHKNQTPGRKTKYRVAARRRGISSPYSNIAQAY